MDKELQLGSYIKLLPPHEKAGKYAFLLNFNNEKEAWHALLIEEKEFAFVPESELTLMPCFHFTTEAMQKLLRYEHTSSDYEGKIVPKGNWDYPEVYEYTLADMQALLLNLQEKKPTDQEYSAWASFLFQDFVMEEAFCCKGEPAYDTTRKIPLTGDFYPKNDAAMAQELFSTFIGESLRDETEGINIPKMLEDIDNYQHQRPIKPYFWSQENKENALPSRLSDPSRSPEEQEELRQLVLALAESLYPKAVEELGYSYYGGNDLFPCDWEKARDCFLKLMGMDSVPDSDKCQYANTLGYIYYYGRCNNGVPEYEKAFYYFSLGAAGGYYESIYKLADLYAHGYGVEKNAYAATALVGRIYNENFELIQKGIFDCKFADVALRMGNYCRDGLMNGDAYYYYTLADFAIRKRMSFDWYGDTNVFSNVQKELARIREERPLENDTLMDLNSPPLLLDQLFRDHSCYVTVERAKKGLKLTIERVYKPKEKQEKAIFECYPEYGYCQLIKSATVIAQGKKLPKLKKKKRFLADSYDMIMDMKKGKMSYHFSCNGKTLFSFCADTFLRKLPRKTEAELQEYKFASVIFNQGGNSYNYICELPDVAVGDKVVVFANGEEKEVTVVRLFQMPIGDMPLAVERYKKILRKA